MHDKRAGWRWMAVSMLALAGCEATIESELTETQANEVLVALHQEHIGATKERGNGTGREPRYNVRVAPADVGAALTVLRAENLPSRPDPGLHEVFGEAGLVPTATEERARYTAAVSGELARSLETMEGVLEARVHIAVPDERAAPLDRARPRPRASVLLAYRPDRDSPDEDAVRPLVAGAVERMRARDVAVVAVPGPSSPARTAASSLVHLGPVTVTQSSASWLKGLAGVALASHLVLAACLVYLLRRR